MSKARTFDVIIIGAGAAGLMCAIEAGKRGRRVLVIEKADTAGRKIRISGGGKSNFTNLSVSADNYLSENPHFCKSALARYTQWDFMELMGQHGLTWEERDHGQLFCEQGARAIIDLLLHECSALHITFIYGCQVSGLDKDRQYTVHTDRNDYHGDSLVIATGGPSIPRMGSTDFGVQAAKKFGLKSIPFRPALVPLTFDPGFQKRYLAGLSGISFNAAVSCNGMAFREQLLITHRGLSGPVILQISSYWHKGASIQINLLPDIDAPAWLADAQRQHPKMELKNLLADKLVSRFAQRLCDIDFGSRPLNQFNTAELEKMGKQLNCWEIQPAGTEGMRTAEVCCGGVSSDELSSKTLQARRSPGLYFIGETIDVTGHLGGFNFQWAWASGWCAGQFV